MPAEPRPSPRHQAQNLCRSASTPIKRQLVCLPCNSNHDKMMRRKSGLQGNDLPVNPSVHPYIRVGEMKNDISSVPCLVQRGPLNECSRCSFEVRGISRSDIEVALNTLARECASHARPQPDARFQVRASRVHFLASMDDGSLDTGSAHQSKIAA